MRSDAISPHSRVVAADNAQSRPRQRGEAGLADRRTPRTLSSVRPAELAKNALTCTDDTPQEDLVL
jgi:hypothetical protein